MFCSEVFANLMPQGATLRKKVKQRSIRILWRGRGGWRNLDWLLRLNADHLTMHDIPNLSIVRHGKILHRLVFLRSPQQNSGPSFDAAARFFFFQQGYLLGRLELLMKLIGDLRSFLWLVLSSTGFYCVIVTFRIFSNRIKHSVYFTVSVAQAVAYET